MESLNGRHLACKKLQFLHMTEKIKMKILLMKKLFNYVGREGIKEIEQETLECLF